MKIVAKWLLKSLVLVGAGMAVPLAITAYADELKNTETSHAHHHMVMPETVRRMVGYTIPDITLVRDDGTSVSLAETLNDGYPVVLNFIYTTCTTVCPVTSQTLSQLQARLGDNRDKVHIVSISIDPEQDTPAQLAAYARKFNAGPEWRHYTGTMAASIAAQRAFDVYRGNKMNHAPVTLLRAAPGQPWVRIDGFATADTLLGELNVMLVSK